MEFNSLEDVYTYLEADHAAYDKEWELTSAIKRLADKTTDELVKNKLRWETFVFDFHIKDGIVKPLHSSTKEDGTTVFAYPSFSDFGEDGLAYLKERVAGIRNDFLVSRYNHILWHSPTPHKHHQYARQAADAYLRILNNLRCARQDSKKGRICLDLLKNGLQVSIESKYKIDEFKTIITSWLFNKGMFPTDLKIFLLNYLLKQNLFKKEELTETLDLVKKIGAAHSKKVTDYFFTKDIYETGLRLAQKLGTDTKVWNKRIGDAIVKMANHRMDDETRMIPLSFLKEAIPYYKLAGSEKKVREIEQRYFELKKELRLSKIEVPLDDEAANELSDYLNAKTAKLMAAAPDDIYGYLLTGADIFPHKKWLVEMGKDRNSAFLDFVTTMRFDINNNVAREKDNKQEKETEKIYENYHLYLRMSVLPFLHRIFIEGIRKGKISFPTLIRFLMEHTWLGQEHTDYDSGGEPIRYNWLSLIAPSLHEYFLQTESALRSTEPYTNYVMPIDSLTLKFEGVLRDFCRLLKISTTTMGKGNVLREKYIEDLLAEKEVHKYFDENDLLLFKFLFVAKGGMNLRNNIAHCFYRFQSYNFQIVHLLICAFLRIGKYRMTIQKDKKSGS